MDKVYTLPDLLPAPYSELQGLVRRLIEYADWSVLPALLDELREQRRELDYHHIRGLIAQQLDPPYWRADADSWPYWTDTLIRIFLFDLFDVADLARMLGEVGWVGKEEVERRVLGRQLDQVADNGRFINLPRRNIQQDRPYST